MRSRFPSGRAVEVPCHARQERPEVATSRLQRQRRRNEAFFGDDHDVQSGNGFRSAKAEALAQDAFDAVPDDGIADFFADGHAESPGVLAFHARQGEQEESLAMVAAARFEAGRELSSRPEPVRRRKA